MNWFSVGLACTPCMHSACAAAAHRPDSDVFGSPLAA